MASPDPGMWTIHGIITAVVIWILKHVRSIRVEMKNGIKKHDDDK